VNDQLQELAEGLEEEREMEDALAAMQHENDALKSENEALKREMQKFSGSGSSMVPTRQSLADATAAYSGDAADGTRISCADNEGSTQQRKSRRSVRRKSDLKMSWIA
jgi:cell division septum initiation protein DivIVA